MFKHDFIGNTTLKKPLERSLYEKAAYNYGVMGDATIVTGPDVIRHITNARQTVCRRATDRICIVEIDKVVAEKHYHLVEAARERERIRKPIEPLIQAKPASVLMLKK